MLSGKSLYHFEQDYSAALFGLRGLKLMLILDTSRKISAPFRTKLLYSSTLALEPKTGANSGCLLVGEYQSAKQPTAIREKTKKNKKIKCKLKKQTQQNAKIALKS